jgi:hypothetical protein
MAITAKQETVRQIGQAVEVRRPDEGVRFFQGRFLDELPGTAFAVITLVWVVTSFAHLIW